MARRTNPLNELERDFQDRVIQWAEIQGWEVFHVADSRKDVGGKLVGDRQARWFPDLVLVRERVLYRELKREGEELSAGQDYYGKRLLAAGADWGVWRPSAWESIRRYLAAGRLAWLERAAQEKLPDRPTGNAWLDRLVQSRRV